MVAVKYSVLVVRDLRTRSAAMAATATMIRNTGIVILITVLLVMTFNGRSGGGQSRVGPGITDLDWEGYSRPLWYYGRRCQAISCFHSRQENGNKRFHHVLAIELCFSLPAKDLLHLNMTNEHSKKRARGQDGIHSPEGPLRHLPLHIGNHWLTYIQGCEEHVGQFVPFE